MREDARIARKRIWDRWWYEPRHFFFAVAVMAPFVYLAALLIASQANATGRLASWLAITALLGFFLCAPAFVLSWIPPARRGFTRMLQHKLLVVASLATLIALFHAVENWRGRSAWNQFCREWSARGVEFELAKIMPPAVPAEENMYEAEPWKGFHFIKSKEGTITFERPTVLDEVWFDCTGPNYQAAPESGDLFLARRVNLAAWQDFYRGTNNQFTAADGKLTNYFPIGSSPQTPARDVLLALSRFDERYRQIQIAAQRPHAQFWLNLEDGMGTLLPHLAKYRTIANHLSLRCAALLADGQTDAGFNDVSLALRIGNALSDEPILISHLVRIAVLQVNLSSVWEGLAAHRWSDAQLEAIETKLATTDLLAEHNRSMAGERYFALWCVDALQRTGDWTLLTGRPDPPASGFDDRIMAANGRILLRLVPKGWFDQNKLSLGRLHVEYILPVVDEERRLVSPAQSRRMAQLVESLRPTPYDLFSRMLLPALNRIATKTASAQAYVDLARVACALERYRLANGNYPENLDVLSPKYISKLPHDVINGGPLKYRRTEDSFTLYSVGWNGTDDGGKVVLTTGKNPRWDQNNGDWVWTYPARGE
jgi:hypothetical protein